MSGGAFDYSYTRVIEFADDLETKLAEDTASLAAPDEWAELQPRLRAAVETARACAAMMKDIEWLFSGDDAARTTIARSAKWPRPPG